MTIGEQNNKNIMGLIKSIPVKPYDDSPTEPDEDALFEFKRDLEVREGEVEVDEDLLFEQARELKLEKGE